MTRDRLWLAEAVLVSAFAATIAALPAGDLAYQLRAGELMLVSGAVLRAAPFTFTAFGSPGSANSGERASPWLSSTGRWGGAGSPCCGRS